MRQEIEKMDRQKKYRAKLKRYDISINREKEPELVAFLEGKAVNSYLLGLAREEMKKNKTK